MKKTFFNSFILDEDLEYLSQFSESIWKKFDNKKIFITGASGFIGKNFLSSFYFMQMLLNYNFSVTSLIRNKNSFYDSSIKSKVNFEIIEGELEKLNQIKNKYDILIHLADQQANHDVYIDKNINETEIISKSKKNISHVFNFINSNDIKHFIYVSSGAVYDKNYKNEAILESHKLVSEIDSRYYNFAINKLTTENEIKKEFRNTNLNYYILRAFTFAGPYLSLDKKKFAFVDFFNNCLNNKDIVIHGNPSSTRSYLYSYELVIWCLKLISLNSKSGFYNFGSSHETTILQLAETIRELTKSKIAITTQKKLIDKNCYVPSINLLKKETEIVQSILLREIIRRYYKWIKRVL